MAKAKQKGTRASAGRRRTVKVDTHGKVFITASFNNVIVSVANARGQVVSWSSAGKMGFRGSKKNTPYAAQQAARDASKVAYDMGMKVCDVFVKGAGAGRESAIRALVSVGMDVSRICDITHLPYNGCRPPKKRRV